MSPGNERMHHGLSNTERKFDKMKERFVQLNIIIKYDFKFCTERHGNITTTHFNVLKRRLFWGFLRLKFILYTIQKGLLTKVCETFSTINGITNSIQKTGNGNTKQISCFANINNTGKRLKFFIRFVGRNIQDILRKQKLGAWRTKV